MKEMNPMVEILIKSKSNEPSYLTGILTNTYFNEYNNLYSPSEASKLLISEFYKLHYGGKNITNGKIIKIVENFEYHLPLLILCVYLEDIVGDDDMVMLCMLNMRVVYKIIFDTYNEFCPSSEKKQFEFSNSIELQVLDCLK